MASGGVAHAEGFRWLQVASRTRRDQSGGKRRRGHPHVTVAFSADSSGALSLSAGQSQNQFAQSGWSTQRNARAPCLEHLLRAELVLPAQRR